MENYTYDSYYILLKTREVIRVGQTIYRYKEKEFLSFERFQSIRVVDDPKIIPHAPIFCITSGRDFLAISSFSF